jgi:predicted nucleic acid-binding protein
MNASCFLDTNILVYAATGHGDDERKRQRALDVLEEAEFGTSGQVLQEFFVTVTRKVKRPLSVPDAAEWIDRVALRPVIPIDTGLVKHAISISGKYQVSHSDAAIIAAAQSLEAPVLYTEDLNHGQAYGSVRAINPFM